jgi:riboflavin kinase
LRAVGGEAAKLQHLHALKHLALLGGTKRPVRVSSREFAEALGASQQAASATLLELLRLGLIKREITSRKQHITLTDAGVAALAREHAELKRVFDPHQVVDVDGVVSSGLGEGAYYMAQEGYASQFERHLGSRPVPGTLNLKLEGDELSKMQLLDAAKGIEITGFTAKDRSFGGAKLFRCELGGIEGGVVMPLRTHHRDIMEIIARKHLRKSLKLKDGDKVRVKVYV